RTIGFISFFKLDRRNLANGLADPAYDDENVAGHWDLVLRASRFRSHLAKGRIEAGHERCVEGRREEDRHVVVTFLHQDSSEDRGDAVREAPDDRVHRAREAPLLRLDD